MTVLYSLASYISITLFIAGVLENKESGITASEAKVYIDIIVLVVLVIASITLWFVGY